MERLSGIRKKPWNRVDLPVYSVSSIRSDGQFNMNICTYATQISMKPKRFIVGIYKNTQTLSNVLNNGHFVLQILSKQHLKHIRRFGMQSGKTHNKLTTLKEPVILLNEFPVLAHACAAMAMKVISQQDAGDHIAMLCDVTAYKNICAEPVLMLSDVREAGIIRA